MAAGLYRQWLAGRIESLCISKAEEMWLELRVKPRRPWT
jgi:hypothetical protein